MTATASSVAVLGFHKIGEPPAGTWKTWNYVPEAAFVSILELLEAGDWSVLDLNALLEGLERPESLPRRAALITFDDGYRSVLEVAEPLLARFGYPSVLFVPTDFIGGTNRFDHGNEPEERICDWGDLRAAQDRGISVQSHGLSHRAISELDPAECGEEFRQSKALLEKHLGVEVQTFAFPFGDGGRDPAGTGELLRESGYRAAFLYKGGLVTLPAADRYRLPRVPVGPDTDLARKLAELESKQDGDR